MVAAMAKRRMQIRLNDEQDRARETDCQHSTYNIDSFTGEKRRYFSFRQQSLLFWRKKNKFSPHCAYIANGRTKCEKALCIFVGSDAKQGVRNTKSAKNEILFNINLGSLTNYVYLCICK